MRGKSPSPRSRQRRCRRSSAQLGRERSIRRTLSLYIAGFEGEPSSAQASQPITLVRIRGGKAEVSRPGECDVLPIAFEPPSLDEPGWSPDAGRGDGAPDAICRAAAHGRPGDGVQEAPEPASIGAGDEKHRRRMFGAFGKTVVQHADLGLLYRTFREARIDGRTRYVADADDGCWPRRDISSSRARPGARTFTPGRP